MKKIITTITIAFSVLNVFAQTYSGMRTYAGPNTVSKRGSTDGPALLALFNYPTAIVIDGSGNLLIADTQNHKVRKISISTDSIVSTYAGNGTRSGTDKIESPSYITTDVSGNVYASTGLAIFKVTPDKFTTQLKFKDTLGNEYATFVIVPGVGAVGKGLVADKNGNLFVATSKNNIIKINSDGVVTNFVGKLSTAGNVDGTGTEARFGAFSGMAIDGDGNIYVSDATNLSIRKITPNREVTTFAGSGIKGKNDGIGIAASFDRLNNFVGSNNLTIDNANNLYVTDYGIRRITPNGEVKTLTTNGFISNPTILPLGNASDGTAIDNIGNFYRLSREAGTIYKIAIQKTSQTITGLSNINKNTTDAAFSLSASASSNLAVTYTSSDTTVAKIVGSTVTIKKAGSTTITASQAGNGIYNAASDVTATLTVNKASQTITGLSDITKNSNDAAFDLSASASSSLEVTYTSSNTDVATISGSTVTIVGAGNTTIIASQAGNTSYNAASDVTATLTINTAIAYVNIPDENFKASLVRNENINTDNDGEISVAEAEAFTGTIGVGRYGTITDLTGIEAFVNITELQCYANQLTSLDVSKNTALTILYCSGNLLTSLDVSKNVALVVLRCNSNQLTTLDVSKNTALTRLDCYSNQLTTLDVSKNTSLTRLNCSGNQLTCIQALNSQDITSWRKDDGASYSENCGEKASQTISGLSDLTKNTTDAAFDLSASASSSLDVTYTSSNTAVATITGSTVTIVGAGNTTITASQAGNDNFAVATDVTTILTVNKVDQTITGLSNLTKNTTDAAFSLSASSTSSLVVTYTSSDTTVAKIVESTVTIKKAGATTITASQAGNGVYKAASDVTATLTVRSEIAPTVITKTACGSYVFNGISQTSTGTYSQTLTGSFGRDSIVTLNLTIISQKTPFVSLANNASNSTINAGESIKFIATPTNVGSNYVYVWKKNNQVIVGQVTSTYTTTSLVNNDLIQVYVKADSSECLTTYTTSLASNVITVITVNNGTNLNVTSNNNAINGSYNNVTIAGRGALSGNVTITGTLTVKKGGVLDLNNHTFTANAVVFEDGAVVIETGNAGSSKLSSTTPILYNRTQSHGGYTYISSPFTSSTGTSGYYYNESGRTGNDYMTGWKNASGNFELGKGYAINGLGTKQITGNQLNNGTVSVTTTSTPTDANTDHNGWNLLGNPYLAPIDVASFLGSNAYPAVYIWNGSNYNTKVSGVIPAGQGFFVQEFSPSNTATFESSFINTALNNSLLRVQNTEEKLSLKLSGANADNTDLYFVASNNVSDNYDITKDALKLFENAVSEIFTLASSKQLAINYMQSNNLDKEIPVGVTITKSGTYSIGIDANNSTYSQVLLKDNVTGTLNDITFNPYTFSINSTGKVADRFVLQLPAARLTGIESATTQLNKAYDNGQFAIAIEGEFEQVNVIDLTGKHIYSGNAKTISVSNTGLYLVEILNGANKNVQKVLVK